METLLISSILRISRRRAAILCQCFPFSPLLCGRMYSSYVRMSTAYLPCVETGRRYFFGRGDSKTKEVAWQPRSAHMFQDVTEEYCSYPMVTARVLAHRKDRPRRVKMLVRDFIDDSLYNPNYGYFAKEAVIFSNPRPFDFNSMQDELEFHRILSKRYMAFEDELDKIEYNKARQVWHTPTELFKPHYGEAIARYLVTNYKLSLYPYHDLLIYEMGAGNGTLMTNILNFIRNTDPDIYQRTKYKVIEISERLTAKQRENVLNAGHNDRVELINNSIFNWDIHVPSPCFFLALEVFDNFAHDMVRYDFETERPLQGIVLIDHKGDFFEFYTPELDPEAARYLEIRQKSNRLQSPDKSLLSQLRLSSSKYLRRLRSQLPFAPNLSQPEFIPTRLMQFFDILREQFPAHRLLTSDFHALPDTIKGINAPVVQTRYKRTTVPVTTVFVQQGYFDILFPIYFPQVEDLYRALTGKLTRVMKHEDFMKRWACIEDTQTQSGGSPLLSWYKNASVMSSV